MRKLREYLSQPNKINKTNKQISKRVKKSRGMGRRQNALHFLDDQIHLTDPRDPFSNRQIVNLRYSQVVTLTAGATGLTGAEQVWRLNSCYDPDLTGTGHQPYGWDQVAGLYRRYIVKRVAFRLKFTDPSDDGIVCVGQVQVSGGTATTTGYLPDVVIERPGSFNRMLNNTGSQEAIVSGDFSMVELSGLTKLQFDADFSNFGAAVSASPGRTPYLRVAVAALDGSSTPTVRCQIEIVYVTEMYERIIQTQS